LTPHHLGIAMEYVDGGDLAQWVQMHRIPDVSIWERQALHDGPPLRCTHSSMYISHGREPHLTAPIASEALLRLAAVCCVARAAGGRCALAVPADCACGGLLPPSWHRAARHQGSDQTRHSCCFSGYKICGKHSSCGTDYQQMLSCFGLATLTQFCRHISGLPYGQCLLYAAGQLLDRRYARRAAGQAVRLRLLEGGEPGVRVQDSLWHPRVHGARGALLRLTPSMPSNPATPQSKGINCITLPAARPNTWRSRFLWQSTHQWMSSNVL
jgi:hypothetical protein